MALQLWMPLMGDLRNQGLGSYSISSLGTISWVDGKLGAKAMKAGNDTQTVNGVRIEDTFVDLLNGNHSVSVWVKPYGNHVHYNGSIFSSGNWNTAKKRWAFGVSQDNTKVDVLCSDYNTYINCTVPVNQWTHLVCTCDSGRIVRLYKNGEFIGTVDRHASNAFDSDNTFTCIGRESYANGYFSFNGAIQDFRLYDHCLSEMEVKQLSQGLVLHYPLNRQGFGQENLMPNSIEMPVGSANPSTGTWRLAGDSRMTRSRVSIPDAPTGASTYGFQSVGLQTGQDASCWGIDSFPKENGEVYTISAWGRIVGGSTTAAMLGFSLYNATTLDYGGTYGSALSSDAKYYGSGAYDYAGGQLNPNGNWTRIYRTFTSTSTSGNIYIGFNTAKTGSNVTLQLCGVKLEKGNKMTPWIPNSNESMYTTLDLNGTTEYDCSGYCNNGTRTGIFSWTSNTPKYAVSQIFNGTNNAIQTPSLPTMITDKNYTIAVWIYKTAIGSKGYQTIYGGPSGFEIEARNGGTSEAKFVAWNWGKPAAAYEFNEWNHCVFVHSDDDCKVYLNGEYVATGTAKASNPSGNYFVGAWNTATQQNFDGLMSDFRIYATALSPTDVKSLYQNCATIDPDGTIRGQIRS